MNLDILESIRSTFSGPLIKQMSGFLGESEEGTRSAAALIGPAVLGTLMRKSATPSGAADLHSLVTSDSVDAGIVGKLSDLLGNRGSLDPLLSGGEQLVGSLLGNRAGGLTHAVSQAAGIKPSSATALLAMFVPTVLGFLKKHVTQAGLDSGGLAQVLQDQRGSLEKIGLDSRVTSALGFGSMTNLLGSIPGAVADSSAGRLASGAMGYAGSTAAAAASRPQSLRWLPWALGAAVVLLVGWWWGSRATHRPADTTAAVADSSLNRMRLASLPAKVYFETGDSNVAGADREAIATLATSIRSADGSVAVTGYTDRTGDADKNLALAKDRAASVHDALVAEGVSEARIVMAPPAFVTGTGSDAEARRVEITVAER